VARSIRHLFKSVLWRFSIRHMEKGNNRSAPGQKPSYAIRPRIGATFTVTLRTIVLSSAPPSRHRPARFLYYGDVTGYTTRIRYGVAGDSFTSMFVTTGDEISRIPIAVPFGERASARRGNFSKLLV